MFHVILELKSGYNALSLSPDRSLEAAGRRPGVESRVINVPKILQRMQLSGDLSQWCLISSEQLLATQTFRLEQVETR